jgi:hypothetical protein
MDEKQNRNKQEMRNRALSPLYSMSGLKWPKSSCYCCHQSSCLGAQRGIHMLFSSPSSQDRQVEKLGATTGKKSHLERQTGAGRSRKSRLLTGGIRGQRSTSGKS